MDLYTIGKNPSDVCLVEELVKLNDKKITKRICKLFLSLDSLLNNMLSSKPDTISMMIKREYIKKLGDTPFDTKDKVRSYARCSINSKVNDWSRECFILNKKLYGE